MPIWAMLHEMFEVVMAMAFANAHCPRGCTNPQPLLDEDRILCARCYFQHGHETVLSLPDVSRETMNEGSVVNTELAR